MAIIESNYGKMDIKTKKEISEKYTGMSFIMNGEVLNLDQVLKCFVTVYKDTVEPLLSQQGVTRVQMQINDNNQLHCDDDIEIKDVEIIDPQTETDNQLKVPSTDGITCP